MRRDSCAQRRQSRQRIPWTIRSSLIGVGLACHKDLLRKRSCQWIRTLARTRLAMPTVSTTMPAKIRQLQLFSPGADDASTVPVALLGSTGVRRKQGGPNQARRPEESATLPTSFCNKRYFVIKLQDEFYLWSDVVRDTLARQHSKSAHQARRYNHLL